MTKNIFKLPEKLPYDKIPTFKLPGLPSYFKFAVDKNDE
jgi:hypothetical protein